MCCIPFHTFHNGAMITNSGVGSAGGAFKSPQINNNNHHSRLDDISSAVSTNSLQHSTDSVCSVVEHGAPFDVHHQSSHDGHKSHVITLDVGGLAFHTHAHILRQSPFFDRLIAGEHLPRDLQGHYDAAASRVFVERDGTHFGTVLAYLRDPITMCAKMPTDVDVLRAVRTDASFYGIASLVQMVDQRIANVDRVIVMSVGGCEYQVTAATLRTAPPTSILHRLANEPDTFAHDHKHRAFIDRDGELFAPLLDYLRTGDITVLPCAADDRAHIARLEREAQYYQLDSFIDRLYSRLHPWRTVYAANVEERKQRAYDKQQQRSVSHSHQPRKPTTSSLRISLLRSLSRLRNVRLASLMPGKEHKKPTDSGLDKTGSQLDVGETTTRLGDDQMSIDRASNNN